MESSQLILSLKKLRTTTSTLSECTRHTQISNMGANLIIRGETHTGWANLIISLASVSTFCHFQSVQSMCFHLIGLHDKWTTGAPHHHQCSQKSTDHRASTEKEEWTQQGTEVEVLRNQLLLEWVWKVILKGSGNQLCGWSYVIPGACGFLGGACGFLGRACSSFSSSWFDSSKTFMFLTNKINLSSIEVGNWVVAQRGWLKVGTPKTATFCYWAYLLLLEWLNFHIFLLASERRF